MKKQPQKKTTHINSRCKKINRRTHQHRFNATVRPSSSSTTPPGNEVELFYDAFLRASCTARLKIFHTTQAKFLGNVITPGTVQMDNAKVKAVLEWSVPSVREQLRVLGFANFYRRFIRGFHLLTDSPHLRYVLSGMKEQIKRLPN